VDAVVHLGGLSTGQPWSAVPPANIAGLHNLYAAARHQGVRRIVFGSSEHVTGCHDTDEFISPERPARPDGRCGVSKLFGEALASLYVDRHGIGTSALGACSHSGRIHANRLARQVLPHCPDLAQAQRRALIDGLTYRCYVIS
jgi:nucleoside-diphosphate-sugar epimerase